MRLFTTPEWVQKPLRLYGQPAGPATDQLHALKASLRRFTVTDPEVSIIIPAYNEEANILQTLASLAAQTTRYRTELIVANNNSTDRTQELLDLCGVQSVFVTEQGISYARQGGLERAKGRFIVSADADSLYPPTWVDALVKPLEQADIACSYGLYSFIPSEQTNRFTLSLHEATSETFKRIKRRTREFVDVMGFNFAFRKADALAVGGYRHDFNSRDIDRCEDGWMAYCLSERGRLQRVGSSRARVWTSDRRLMVSGSLGKAYLLRVKKEVSRLSIYMRPVTQ